MVSCTPPPGACRHCSPMARRCLVYEEPLGAMVPSRTFTGPPAPKTRSREPNAPPSPNASAVGKNVLRVSPFMFVVFRDANSFAIVATVGSGPFGCDFAALWLSMWRASFIINQEQVRLPRQEPARSALHDHIPEPRVGLGIRV